jgi:hypothetical protein
MARQLFVYWRVPHASVDAALAAVHAAQARLRDDWPGLDARVYQRSDLAPEATVMETYETPGGIDAAGQARIDARLAQALAALPVGTRHVEAFERR